MKRETLISLAVIAVGLALLAARWFATDNGFGKVYVRAEAKSFVEATVPPAALEEGVPPASTGAETVWLPADSARLAEPGVTTTGRMAGWTIHNPVPRGDAGAAGVELSWPRTIGLWFAAFLSLCIFSFLYGDNPFYKFAEAIFIGVSAAYWMVIAFWNVIVPNLIANLAPDLTRAWAMPGLGPDAQPNLWYVIPLMLSILLLWRLAPVGGWISRWPLAFFIGVFAGLRMIQFIHADFLNQVENSIVPLMARDDNGYDWSVMVWNLISVLGLFACLTYFFFSIEHKGVVGKVARVGTWILMITFGAMFGFTVMGRIALLTDRFEFLLNDWLWIGQ